MIARQMREYAERVVISELETKWPEIIPGVVNAMSGVVQRTGGVKRTFALIPWLVEYGYANESAAIIPLLCAYLLNQEYVVTFKGAPLCDPEVSW